MNSPLSSLPINLSKAEINEKLEKPDLIFKGYCTDYRYYNFNFWEYSEAMFADKWDANNNPLRNVPAGHAIGHASDSIMELTITSAPQHASLNDYSQTLVWAKNTLGYSRSVPIELHHSDVLPSLLEGEAIKAQVVLMADKVQYIITTDPEYLPHMPPDPIYVYREDEELTTDNANRVHLVGGIRHIDHIPATDIEDAKVCVWVWTHFGPLCIVHPLNDVPVEERDAMIVGHCIGVTGKLVGDCAIDDYQEGARYDRTNFLRLLRDSLMTGRLFRMFRSLENQCDLTMGFDVVRTFKNKEDHREELLSILSKLFGNGTLEYGHITAFASGNLFESTTPCLIHKTPNNRIDALIRLPYGTKTKIGRIDVETKPKAWQFAECKDFSEWMNYEKVHKEAYKKQLLEMGQKVGTTIHVGGLANHMKKPKE